MSDSSSRDLNYHHAEISRLKAAIAAARPDSSRTNAMRSMLKYHEGRIGRADGSVRGVPSYP
jgi:hypothetical protein